MCFFWHIVSLNPSLLQCNHISNFHEPCALPVLWSAASESSKDEWSHLLTFIAAAGIIHSLVVLDCVFASSSEISCFHL